MSFIEELDLALRDLLGEGTEPVVVSSAVWPILREMGRRDMGAVDEILSLLLQRTHGRDLLMPSFASGYVNGTCDLDNTPGSTGILCERFRLLPGTRRSLSAFFSYVILGSGADMVGALMPEHAWGDESLYFWMEQRNARFLMLGTHPTHCSYLHRLEWIVRDVLPYRYCKTFSGTLIRDGAAIPCSETLYVRSLVPEAIQDFTTLVPVLAQAGMQQRSVRGVPLASYNAVPLRDAVVPRLRENPLLVLKNARDFENKLIEMKKA